MKIFDEDISLLKREFFEKICSKAITYLEKGYIDIANEFLQVVWDVMDIISLSEDVFESVCDMYYGAVDYRNYVIHREGKDFDNYTMWCLNSGETDE